jgi:hypothetical protein
MLEENIILGDKIIKNAYFKEDLNFFFFWGGRTFAPTSPSSRSTPKKRGSAVGDCGGDGVVVVIRDEDSGCSKVVDIGCRIVALEFGGGEWRCNGRRD